jgi:hypothetical protein
VARKGKEGRGGQDTYGGESHGISTIEWHDEEDTQTMLKFLLWLLLLALCWPLAILALLLWPIVWLLSLPFRLIGIAVEGIFDFLRALITLPARILGAR